MTRKSEREFVMLPVIQSRDIIDDISIKGREMTYFLKDNLNGFLDGTLDELPLVIFENDSGINLPPWNHYWCNSPVCFHSIKFDRRHCYTHGGRGRGKYVVMTGGSTF
jgi:hypothetical protein